METIENLLVQLKKESLSSSTSKEKLLQILEQILLWLNNPDNNTNENCKKIDYFVSYEIVPQKEYESIPGEIKEILFDMGASLSDTYTSPEIAENFESTPKQLLSRVQKIKEAMK